MHPSHNTLPENIRAQSAELLNQHLGAAIDLHAQVKQAHWNVRGPNFIAIHALFDKVSVEVLNPYPLDVANEVDHAFAVSGALAAFGQSVRRATGQAVAFGDADTADLFTEISRGVSKQLWFIESHIPQKQ